MKLRIPKESPHLKEWIKSVEKLSPKTPGVKWESLNVWYGNQIPKYLWGEWKDELKETGFTWQKFLKLLGHRKDLPLLWFKGNYTWEQFINEVNKLIEGPMCQEISKT